MKNKMSLSASESSFLRSTARFAEGEMTAISEGKIEDEGRDKFNMEVVPKIDRNQLKVERLIYLIKTRIVGK